MYFSSKSTLIETGGREGFNANFLQEHKDRSAKLDSEVASDIQYDTMYPNSYSVISTKDEIRRTFTFPNSN